MANFTGLAAARHHVLAARRLGRGERRPPRRAAGPRSWSGPSATSPIDAALRFLGLGRPAARSCRADGQGRMRAAALARGAGRRPAGRRSCARRPATSTPAPSTRCPRSAPPPTTAAPGCTWTERSGCGRRPARRLRHLLAGVGQADSWATDAHKWLNVPYDCGLVFCAHPEAHRAADATAAGYLTARGRRASATPSTGRPSSRAGPGGSRSTRRCARSAAPASPTWWSAAARLARRFAARLAAADGVEVLNEVVLNQVLVRFPDRAATTTAAPARWCAGSRPTAPAG